MTINAQQLRHTVTLSRQGKAPYATGVRCALVPTRAKRDNDQNITLRSGFLCTIREGAASPAIQDKASVVYRGATVECTVVDMRLISNERNLFHEMQLERGGESQT